MLPFYSTVTDASATVGTASTTLRAACSRRMLLVIHNASTATAIAVNLSGGTAAINTAGSITMAAGATMYLDTSIPSNAITAIAASPGTPVTCYVIENPQ